MYAKFINADTIEVAPNVKDGAFFNYDSELNQEMLLADGYFPVEETPQPTGRYVRKYKLEAGKIITRWQEVIEQVDFETLRSQRQNALQQELWEIKQTTKVEYAGMQFAVNDSAKQNLTSVLVLAQTLGGDIQYFEANGTAHTFTLDEFKPLAQSIIAKMNEIDLKYSIMNQQLLQATQVSELSAVKW